MKFFSLVVALGMTLALAGCLTIDSAKVSLTGEEQVVVVNRGFTLFGVLPLFSGNATVNGRVGEVAFFRDDVTLEKVEPQLMDYARKHNKSLSDLTVHHFESVRSLLPIPYILCRHDLQLSGVMK